MDSRRQFVGTVAYGLAGTLAAGSKAQAASDRIRVGLIGAGDRGTQLAHHVKASGNAEVVAAADVYARRRELAAGIVPSSAIHNDYRKLLDDPAIDAVVIATPQHLHASQFEDAIAAGKHVYLEKTAALTIEQAKRMRDAYRGSGSRQVVSIGHQVCSSGHVKDVRRFLAQPEQIGDVTAITMQMYRNTPRNKPQWARTAMLTRDLHAGAVDWTAFNGEAGVPFDAHRFVHWRYFWQYSGGSVFEHMSQQLAFWYKTLDLEIPRAATMNGGIYLWKDGREVPDTVNVSLEQPEGMLISWASGLGNNQLNASESLLGTNGSVLRASQVKYVPQKVNRPDLKEATGRTAHTPHAHMQDFLSAIRMGGETACGLELGYRVTVACRMAVESYLQGRTVRWDADREQIT